METTTVEINVKGKTARVPGVCVNGRKVVCEGTWLKIASVHDDLWVEGQPVDRPGEFLSALKGCSLRADLFSFPQALPETTPKYDCHLEWDNWAAAPTSDFKSWWEGMPQESRKNVRRAERRGVVVRTVEFNDELVRGIKGIYDEAPVRQGRRFWHYGKSLDVVKEQNSSYLDRSQFIGAYYNEELIGFIKMVYVGPTARIMQILSRNAHVDKRPTNALLAKAVEVCSKRPVSCLIYGQYIYDNKTDSPVTEFKRRNGFHQLLLPRYYLPVTLKGRIALAAGLHRGVKGFLPGRVITFLSKMRQTFYERFVFAASTSSKALGANPTAGADVAG